MGDYQKLSGLIIANPSITLKEGEVCFYENHAFGVKDKNVVTGYMICTPKVRQTFGGVYFL